VSAIVSLLPIFIFLLRALPLAGLNTTPSSRFSILEGEGADHNTADSTSADTIPKKACPAAAYLLKKTFSEGECLRIVKPLSSYCSSAHIGPHQPFLRRSRGTEKQYEHSGRIIVRDR
jgi:hypothetical protein